MIALTPTETGVLVCLADGLRHHEIADERQVTVHTVNAQVKSIRFKMGAKTSAHAVALAYHRGLLIPMGRAA